MKKVLVGLFFGLFSMFFLSHNSQAEMRGPMGDPGKGCHDEGMHMMPPPMGPPVMDMMEGIPEAQHFMSEHLTCLGLDEKQREVIKEIKNKVMKETIKKRADGHIAGLELKDLLDKDPVNMKAVEAKLKQIELTKTEMHVSLIRAGEEIKSKLTPEQRTKFREMLEMEPDIGPPMMRGIMRGGMRMIPPPPCPKREEMPQDMEHMPHKAR